MRDDHQIRPLELRRPELRRPGPRLPEPQPPGLRPVDAWGLLIPVDLQLPCQTVLVSLTAAGISDVIGGGLLDEVACLVPPGGEHTIYQDETWDTRSLPDNSRAFRLGARLGWPHLVERRSLRGAVLVLGLDAKGQDIHVPGIVLEAAVREGLLPGGTATGSTPRARIP